MFEFGANIFMSCRKLLSKEVRKICLDYLICPQIFRSNLEPIIVLELIAHLFAMALLDLHRFYRPGTNGRNIEFE